MNRALKKILIFLLMIIVLPALSFAVYEFASLNDTEELLEEIYSRQLETIIFSVNQYSEDVVSNWRSSISRILIDEGGSEAKLDSLVREITTIKSIFAADSSLNNITILYNDSSLVNKNYNNLQNILSFNKDKITRLYTYKRGGYFKIEPLENAGFNKTTVLVFVFNEPSGNLRIGGMVIDSYQFAQNIIGPRIKNMTENDIAIGVYNEQHILFGTDEFDQAKIQSNKQLWILPGYHLGIALRGETIKDFVKERTFLNLLLIAAITFLLMLGAFLIYRSIRHEVELAQIKSDFVSNVSHELRTPLSLISMFAETLEMGRVRTEEKKGEYYSIISQEAGRLSRIVNKILNFSQIEAGKRKYHFEEKNLNKIIENVYKTYQFHLQNNGFKFSFIPEENIPDTRLDSEAVSEAVINMIDNAMKYSKELKEVNISTGKENGFIFAEISDKGIGIAEEDKKKIYDKFFRVSTGDVHNVKGTGLGLTIVSHIINAHKGDIELKSKVGKGSIFRLKFPIENGA